MKISGIKPLARYVQPTGPLADHLTQLLVGTAIVLLATLVALTVDFVTWPRSGRSESQTMETGQSPASLPPSPIPSPLTPASGAVARADSTPPPCVVPGDWGSHIVERGDTLYSLAGRYGTDVDSLMRANCLDSATILVDQRLYVPGPLALPTFATPTPEGLLAFLAAGTPRPGASATPGAGMAGAPPASASSVEVPMAALPPPVSSDAPKPAFRVDIPDRYLHIALLGTDLRYKGRPQRTWRTDAIIIASIDVEDHTVRLLHVPRDLWVYIPGHGYNRINTAVLWGELEEKGSGPEWVKRTIYHNLGIPIHYYFMMNFRGFVDAIDTIGGVEIDVACPYPEINLEPGMVHMDGETALSYVHRRDTTDDYDRGRRQRQMLMALWDQALTPQTILKLPQLWVTMADSFQTDMPLDQAINLAYLGLQIESQHILQEAISNEQTRDWLTPEGALVLLPREEEIQTLLTEFYAPKDKQRLDETHKVRVRVLNGSGWSQAALLAAAPLNRSGFKVVGKGVADSQDYATTQIMVFRGDLAAGEQIARQLGVPISAVEDHTAEASPVNPSDPADIQVILGRDYDPCQR